MLNPQDFIIETFNAGSTWFPRFTGIKLTHKPTSTVVIRDTERSSHANRSKAWDSMKEMLDAETDITKQLELF